MSKTNESKLYNLIKTNLKNVHFMRIESYTEQGIPDVNACYNGKELWLELKCNTAKNLGLSKYQIVWIMRRVKHGGVVWIANRPPRQRATFFYSGSLVRGSGISANEQPTFVVSPNDLTWDAAKEILWPPTSADLV
jgi:Holliday junction resolvase